MPSFTVEADGKVIPFEAPAGASPQQIKTLAARALKRETGKPHQTPVLERGLMERLAPKDQGSISVYKPTLAEKISDKAAGALSYFGMDERRAHRLGDKITSALTDLTPVGAATSADDAKRAFGRGDYLAGVGNSALAALSAVPEVGGVSKAMFLGVGAKIADKVALAKAEKMAAAGADRKQIWADTGWFQGADNKWRFEVPDDQIHFDAAALRGRHQWGVEDNQQYLSRMNASDEGFRQELRANGWDEEKIRAFYPLDRNEGVERGAYHPALAEAYDTSRLQIAARDQEGLRGSFKEAGQPEVLVGESLAPQEQRSVFAHELQHFVQGQEGFARGGMVGTIPARQVNPELATIEKELEDALEEKALRADIRDPVTNRIQDEPAWHAVARRVEELQRRLKALQPTAEYEGYRRLAGEVEARNVQTRLDMTPGQRREYAPWETEDVPREDQFVLWYDK